VARSLNELASDFSASETGQNLRAEYEDLKERCQSGELEEKARQELSEALHKIQEELDQISHKWTPASRQDETPKPPDA
jgi:FtsZ-binding cell division protein ZapB